MLGLALVLVAVVVAVLAANVAYERTRSGWSATLDPTGAAAGLVGGGGSGTAGPRRPLPGRLDPGDDTLRWTPGPVGKALHGYRDVVLPYDRIASVAVADDRFAVRLVGGDELAFRASRPDGLLERLVTRGVRLA